MFVLTRLKAGLFWTTAVFLFVLSIAFVGYSAGHAAEDNLVYLPLIMKPAPPPAPRFVVFEAFMRDI